jgi:hypothetical protein
MVEMELSPVEAGQWVVGYRDDLREFQYIAAVDASDGGDHRVYNVDVIHSDAPGLTELQANRYPSPEAALTAVTDWYADAYPDK